MLSIVPEFKFADHKAELIFVIKKYAKGFKRNLEKLLTHY